MKIIDDTYQADVRERGSKFLGHLLPCQSEAHFEQQSHALRSKFFDATHHCYGYRIGINPVREYSSDDGEPGGTAGLPILNQLRSFDVVNAGLIVIRYYGGTKLGKPGLIEAYGNTAKECLMKAALRKIISVRMFEIRYPYNQENVVHKLFLNYGLTEMTADYQVDVTKEVACPLEKAGGLEKELIALEHLGIAFHKKEESFIPLA